MMGWKCCGVIDVDFEFNFIFLLFLDFTCVDNS